MVALFTMDDKIYIGKSENYDNKGHYDNKDNSLLYVTDCQAAFTFLSSEGCIHSQDEALKQGIYTKEDYEEFSRITDFLSQAGFTPEKEFFFADKPFSLQADKPEQAAPETKTIYYTINEGAARRANDMNSFSDYKPGSATAEYRQMVDKAVEIAERQKKRVDPMYHEKIDSLVDTYARKLAENMNSSFSIEARVPSVLIAGGSNFPVRKKEKQNAARDRNMEDWNEIHGGTVEANREDNRLQIYFEEKPDEKTRETLKENGFRWSPKAGAWQRQLNDNAIYAADRIKCIQPLSGKSPTEIQKEARTAAKTEKKPSIRAQLAQDKETLKNAPKKAAEKTKKQDLERS